jgi:hypothetical protein
LSKEFEVTPEEIDFLAKFIAGIYVEALAVTFILWWIITLLGKYVGEPYLKTVKVLLLF